MIRSILITCTCLLLLSPVDTEAQTNKPGDSLKNISLSGLRFRSIGPAITGGRIIDLAVNPNNPGEYYAASGHGSLWKTVNNGITFSPAFEGQPVFAMGAVRIDPSNTNIVWVGTGEHNNQTNVIYGDGVYKSEDGGKSWKNMGLKESEHIGGIVIDPTNGSVVYAAAYGPVRRPGGDRGIYKTTDGGKSWRKVLNVSENTGFFEIHMDPKNNHTLYAVAHQRGRAGFTSVSGGNESAIYRTVDSGATWQKVMRGLPSENIGRIGLSISPVNSDVVYALVQAKEGSGLYRSSDRGMTWNKQSSYTSAYPFYMQKIFADPKDVNKLYSMDLLIQVSIDGGKTFRALGEKFKHVDNHALWIDPNNTAHLISGNDGGVYETWDNGQNWGFKDNIPITEIYKVSTDNALPFYNVYIGTQDNNSLYGPSRTVNSSGISNRDWTFSLGGDGFETQADWKDDRIIYAQSQNGGLVRYDKQSGERLYIQPVNFIDSGYRFDWDAPLLISKHNNKRIYFAANKLFRSNDQGSTWDVLSGDLTRGVPQKMERAMGKSWSIDEMAGKSSQAHITTIAESPLDENILYTGSGDGLIFYSTDGGKSWSASSSLPGVTTFTRIHHIIASQHNKLVAYAACQGFATGDFKPVLLKTSDGGKTWESIHANLPAKGNTYTIAEDHVNVGLLFVGTQFGLYMTTDGGKEWIKFMNGLPTATYMDIEIQKRENDLVVSTFGRGIYILDDYSPLRHLGKETLQQPAAILPVKKALMFLEADPFGFSGAAFQGANFFNTKNPEVGATFTYYIKDEFKTLKQKRNDLEKEKQKKNEDLDYPDYATLKKEAEQPDPYLLFVITDESGNMVRKMKTNARKGVNRITWDLRYQPFSPISFVPFDDSYAWSQPEVGYMVAPGTYKVSLQLFEDGTFRELVAPQSFECIPLNNNTISAGDKKQLDAFNKKVAELVRAMNGANNYRIEMTQKLPYLRQAILNGAQVPASLTGRVQELQRKLETVNREFNGDGARGRYEGAVPISLRSRVLQIAGALWGTTAAPTQTFVSSYDVAAGGFATILQNLKSIAEDIKQLEVELEKYKAPYTPGRLPDWKKE